MANLGYGSDYELTTDLTLTSKLFNFFSQEKLLLHEGLTPYQF